MKGYKILSKIIKTSNSPNNESKEERIVTEQLFS